MKLDFRKTVDRKQGLKSWYHMQQPVCSVADAALAIQWMAYCDRVGRRYDQP